MLKVDLPKNQSSIIKVIGVGGGGSNAVNYMYNQGINGVDFIICNTDSQSLDASPIPTKVQLGKGLGAGNVPSVAKIAAEEKADEIKALLEKNTQMLFITAGMGGGTGTGAAPVIAAIAKEIELSDDLENKILTVAIVTLPFSFEGRKRKLQAEEGIKELRKHVDAILIINNDKLREFGDLPLDEAFEKADNILTTAAKGIAEIITVKAFVNIDFRDVNTVMKQSGVALMGSGIAEGENRAYKAIEMAINSPLLNDNNIKGAKNILLYFASGSSKATMDEITEITDFILNEAGQDVDIIWGAGTDDSLGNNLSITLVATGFDKNHEIDYASPKVPEKIKIPLEVEKVDVVQEIIKIETPQIQDDIFLNDIKIIEKKEETKNTPIFTIESPNSAINFKINNYQNEVKSNEDDPYIKPKQETKTETIINQKPETSFKESDLSDTEIDKKSTERIQRLKDLSMKLRTPEGLSELENSPAYIRRNVVLSDVTPSSESEISRFTLTENDDKKVEIKSNNSFLHDNVD
ncbi:MAG: cell division protein FtsZ [Bacteroidetes bacterium]|nr:cell division protein FtsZ [Bacteroidota bacterium]